ncbi:MAG: glycoside hydrolase domain-containing protein, partial [Planctomycetota bacterium]
MGAAVFLSTGRFDGSLHLAGGPCGFRTPPYPELTSGKAFTIDALIRPEGADGSTTVATEANARSSQIILHMPNRTQQGGGYEVRRLVDGHLEVLCGSHLLGVSTCAVPNRSWTHVAMIVTPPRTTPGRFAHIENHCNEQVILVINGAVDATFEHPAITPELRRLSGQVFVGNDAAGSAGFVGDIDEVRVSKGLLKFYDDHRDEFFADAGPEVGPPVMRDPFEMILHESFDIAGQPPEHPVNSAVRGSCSLLGDGHGIKTLPLNASIDLAKGTLEIWIRPDDWDNRQEQQLQQPLFSIPVVAITAQASQNAEPKTILTASLHSMKPVLHAPPAINPGTWHHLVLAWEGDSRRAFLDGAPLPNGILAWSIITTPDLLSLPIRTLKVGKAAAGGNYRGEDTFFDELRLYRRPFTPIEMVNAFRRFVPGGHVDPLPFAFVDWGLNMATQSMTADIELLDARRDAVASVEVTASGPGLTHRVTLDRSPSPPRDKTKAQGPHDATTGIIDGHARLTTTGIGLEYGKHTLSLRFLDGTGALVETLSIDRERLIPPWWHSTVGLHEGIPPPGFEPVRVTKEKEDRISVELSERRIDIDARGWPAAMVSKAANMLAGPIKVEAIAGGATLDWQPRKEPLAVEESAADRVRIRGGMTASGWAMDTETTIECDGLVRIATAVTAPQAGELERLTVTIPLKQEHATLLGFWTGNPDFRNACRYGDTPPHQGIVFASTKPWAARSTQIVGSFMPFVSLADNERGLNWFAENDRHWTKSALVPAIEIERLADKVLLRLTLVHEKTAVDEP